MTVPFNPAVYSYKDPDPVFPYGMPTVNFGIANGYAIDGMGLVSRGFLWNLYQIWQSVDDLANITTTWSAWYGASFTTTVWSAAAGSSISTSWSNVRFGMWGEYSPG